MKPLKAIVATTLNGVIGKDNTIPWHIPEDFKFFKKTTMGHILVMGRKTYESIGRPLPGRKTIVLTSNPDSVQHKEVDTISSIKELENIHTEENQDIFICGGARVYKELLPYCSDLYLTLVNKEIEGDTCFPDFKNLFNRHTVIEDNELFKIIHYTSKASISNGTKYSVSSNLT